MKIYWRKVLGLLIAFGVFNVEQARAQSREEFEARNQPYHPVQEIQPQFAPADYISLFSNMSVDDLRATMLKSWMHGVNPAYYWQPEMEKAYQAGGATAPGLKAKADANYLKLLQDISVGSANPGSVGNDIKFVKRAFLSPKYLQMLVSASGSRPDLVMDNLAPQNPPYIALRAAMAKLYPACADGTWAPLKPFKKPLKLGTKSVGVIELKNRLSLLGYQISSFDDTYDKETQLAINDIQWNLHWKPDGVLSPGGRTWKFLSVSCKDRTRQMQADMEKMRWFPQTFPEKYIFVNTAMTYFGLVDKTQPERFTMAFKTINGRPARKTPTMADNVVRVILNPYWVVPPTIFIQDKVEDIKKLNYWEINSYFDSHNYEVWNKEFTRRLDPASINWWAYDGTQDADIYIRQKPHLGNALGIVKFELTNAFAIYLHDTNQRELFVEANRQLSSGCVRLEKPLDLAEYLLRGTQWTRQAIESTIAKPGQVMTKDTKIPLKEPTAVYIGYITSQMFSDRVIRFTEDAYKQNNKVLSLMRAPF
ncbi:L,D-transpeptidase family protein [Bdellovibrio sp. SKB1291214]|uniref:L,D-transpeptidase family protein n=1 Tax=Bdellovibrio sp. SKB1291214 TaxID=1732569 RepID=UPI000B51DE5F|nr:L,D-transpeptidase family protein [Bdellovibrio sp. SKB1291214]UYL10087.1 L,D-transpeptidase family protein [Bdellovibrio sp. SKB1291214]